MTPGYFSLRISMPPLGDALSMTMISNEIPWVYLYMLSIQSRRYSTEFQFIQMIERSICREDLSKWSMLIVLSPNRVFSQETIDLLSLQESNHFGIINSWNLLQVPCHISIQE